MTKKEEEDRLKKYFFGENETEVFGKKVELIDNKKFKMTLEQRKCSCPKMFFEKLFDLKENEINCNYYSMVVSGEGGEDKKIDTYYSSSLQSLLFFYGVSDTNPIIYDKVKYTKVFFEWKNKVIKLPSSIDVVLVDETGKNALFIESKLYEVIRDSNKEGNCVVGSSYLNNEEKNGYNKKLSLTEDDYKKIGIDPTKLDEKKRSIIKPIVKDYYVYSYGIKQMLSHIIGLLNFNPKYDKNAYVLPVKENVNISFLTIINEMNGASINEDDEDRNKHFMNHYNKVIELLKDKEQVKGKINLLECTTYQDFYGKVKEKGFKVPGKVIKYYHIEG